jgi:hypothetical protein
MKGLEIWPFSHLPSVVWLGYSPLAASAIIALPAFSSSVSCTASEPPTAHASPFCPRLRLVQHRKLLLNARIRLAVSFVLFKMRQEACPHQHVPRPATHAVPQQPELISCFVFHACICYSTVSDAVSEPDWRVISVGDVLLKGSLCYTAELAKTRERKSGGVMKPLHRYCVVGAWSRWVIDCQVQHGRQASIDFLDNR